MAKVSVKGTIVSSDQKWIYDWFGIDSTSPKDVENGLLEANGDDVTVEINSGGGDVIAGSEIYYLIATYLGNVTVDVVGIAASAASYIMAAGNIVRSVPTGMVMIHNVSSSARGDYHEMDKESKILRNFNKAVSNAYRLKTKLGEAELLALMDTETWMPAQDALEKGFIDEIIGDEHNMLGSKPLNLFNSYSANVLPQNVIDKIRNTLKGPAFLNDDAQGDEPIAEPITEPIAEPIAEPTSEPEEIPPDGDETSENETLAENEALKLEIDLL